MPPVPDHFNTPLDKKFLKGLALSVWQNSSDTSSQWTKYIQDKNYLGQKKYKAAFEHAADFWNMWVLALRWAEC